LIDLRSACGQIGACSAEMGQSWIGFV